MCSADGVSGGVKTGRKGCDQHGRRAVPRDLTWHCLCVLFVLSWEPGWCWRWGVDPAVGGRMVSDFRYFDHQEVQIPFNRVSCTVLSGVCAVVGPHQIYVGTGHPFP